MKGEAAIVPMLEEHLSGVLEIERECFRRPWSRASMAAEMGKEGSVCLVALLGREVGGYAMAGRVLDEGQILRLAVRPGLRQRGLGRKLASAALRALRDGGARRVSLELRESNSVAMGLYEGLGFQVAGRRTLYYPRPGEDAVVMELAL
jgi:ribosomal-protein-alanine N-acetyltransferase